MKTAAEYAKHAAECRALAKNMPAGDAREQLLEMAKTWEILAHERARTLRTADDVGDEGNGVPNQARSREGRPPE
jgi:hypothetical protein